MVTGNYQCRQSCIDAGKTWDQCQDCKRLGNALCNMRFLNVNTFRRTVNPTVNDDENSGYKPGDHWINTVTQVIFHCVDDTAGAAVWK
jgi:hypothetical protein